MFVYAEWFTRILGATLCVCALAAGASEAVPDQTAVEQQFKACLQAQTLAMAAASAAVNPIAGQPDAKACAGAAEAVYRMDPRSSVALEALVHVANLYFRELQDALVRRGTADINLTGSKESLVTDEEREMAGKLKEIFQLLRVHQVRSADIWRVLGGLSSSINGFFAVPQVPMDGPRVQPLLRLLDEDVAPVRFALYEEVLAVDNHPDKDAQLQFAWLMFEMTRTALQKPLSQVQAAHYMDQLEKYRQLVFDRYPGARFYDVDISRYTIVVSEEMQRHLRGLRVVGPGKKLPSVQVSNFKGKVLPLLAGMEGKVVLIDFWATWCGPCVAGIPYLAKFQEQAAGKPFEIVSVSVDEHAQDVIDFMDHREMPWVHRILSPQQLGLRQEWAIAGVPTYLLIDATGVVRYRGHSFDKEVRRLTQQLIDEAAGIPASPEPVIQQSMNRSDRRNIP